MANPADPGTFDIGITLRQPFELAQSKDGDSGTFDSVIGARLPFSVYVAAPAAAPASTRRKRQLLLKVA